MADEPPMKMHKSDTNNLTQSSTIVTHSVKELMSLPKELQLDILGHLNVSNLQGVADVCQEMRKMALHVSHCKYKDFCFDSLMHPLPVQSDEINKLLIMFGEEIESASISRNSLVLFEPQIMQLLELCCKDHTQEF